MQARTTGVPVVPPGARHATINTNGIEGGQPVDGVQTPCVADHCRAVFDRRFLIEEGLDFTRDEIGALVDAARRLVPDIRFEVHDRLIVHPTRTPDDSPIIPALTGAIRTVLGRQATLVASPGTYDHKHVAKVAGVPHCVAYGPGELVQAHQPDEYLRGERPDRCHEGDRDRVARAHGLALEGLGAGGSGVPPSTAQSRSGMRLCPA